MFELTRFIRYALAFEKAFKTDDWAPVRRWFHDDAVYTIVGTPPELPSVCRDEARGADAIMRTFKGMLDVLDRRFDRRIPRPAGWPRKRDGVLVLPWRARYVIGGESAVLTGVSECRFDGGKIRHLKDTSEPEEFSNVWALCERAGKPIAAQA